MNQKQSNLRTCLGRGTLCSGTPLSASTIAGSAADAATLLDVACTDCSLDKLCAWSRAGSLLDPALLPMTCVSQRAGCQDSSSHAVAAAAGGGDHDGAGAAAPVGKSQRLLGGQKLSPAALGLTAA